MKHLLSVCCLLILTTSFLYSLPFTRILLKPEYQIHTTLAAPISVFLMDSEDNQIEYTFSNNQMVEMIQYSDPMKNIVKLEYWTDFDEEDYNLQYHNHGNYEFNLKIGFFLEYIITLEKDKGIGFATLYEYPESEGDYSRDEIVCVETGSIEILE